MTGPLRHASAEVNFYNGPARASEVSWSRFFQSLTLLVTRSYKRYPSVGFGVLWGFPEIGDPNIVP